MTRDLSGDMGKRFHQLAQRWGQIVTEYDTSPESPNGGDVMIDFRYDVGHGHITKRDMAMLLGISFRALALARDKLGPQEFQEMLHQDAREDPRNN